LPQPLHIVDVMMLHTLADGTLAMGFLAANTNRNRDSVQK